MDSLNFVIVGHVDHGKSTLIGRLLYDTDSLTTDKLNEVRKSSDKLNKDTEFAYLLDHLEEERQQGVTIDTTQVFFKTEKRSYVIIDAPGHVEFVKNMITGASQAEAAVLIVDIVEGVKEQTKRHAYILSLLGVCQVIVVLNKMDLLDYSRERFDDVRKDVEKFLDSLDIKPLFYIPISAKKGENVAKGSNKMQWYQGPTLLESLDSLKARAISEERAFIVPVQDIYKIDEKRIIAGRIESGKLCKGDSVKILSSSEVTKISSIEFFQRSADRATVGESVGVVTLDPVFLARGDVICQPGEEPVFTNRFSANIFWLTKKDFNKDEKLIIRLATQEMFCKVIAISKRINSSTLELIGEDAVVLKNLEVGEVVIETKRPIAIKNFNDIQELGRFVLVRDGDTCAGGIITDTGLE